MVPPGQLCPILASALAGVRRGPRSSMGDLRGWFSRIRARGAGHVSLALSALARAGSGRAGTWRWIGQRHTGRLEVGGAAHQPSHHPGRGPPGPGWHRLWRGWARRGRRDGKSAARAATSAHSPNTCRRLRQGGTHVSRNRCRSRQRYPAGSHVGKTRNQRREPHAICHQCAGPPACSKCGAAPAAPITVALVRWWRLCGHGQSGKQLNDEFGVRLLPAAGEETVPSRDAIRSAESVADRIARPNLAGRMSGIQARPRSASHAATAGVTPMRGHLKPCRLRAGHQHPGRGYRPGRRQSEPRAGCRRSAAASPR